MNEAEKIENFFNDSKPVVSIAEQAQARLDRQAATAFSVFDYFHAHETDLSRVFADLLDPAGTHGQGDSFLRLFLDELEWSAEYQSPKLKECEVDLEQSTDEGRRIDIVLKIPDNPVRWIGIENKPWAGEQEKQITDYLKYLAKQDSKAQICYFSGDGSKPSSLADQDESRCQTVPYRKTDKKPSVENWIERSWQTCEAESVRCFLMDLLKYIRWNFELKDTPKVAYKGDIVNQTMVDFILGRIKSNPEYLGLACCIADAVPKVKQHLITTFIKKIESYLEEWIKDKGEGREDLWMISSTSDKPDQHMKKNDAWVVLHKKKWELENEDWPAAGAGLCTDVENWGKVSISVAAPDEYDEDKLLKCLRDAFGKTETLRNWANTLPTSEIKYVPTPACKYLPHDQRDWYDKNFLKKLENQKQADKIAKEIADELCELALAVEDIFDKMNLSGKQ